MDTPTPEIQELAVKIRETMSRAFSKVSDPISEDELTAQIHNLLINERRGMILKLLGIDTSWGRLEMDRNGGSFKKFMEQRAAPLIDKYLETELIPILESQLQLKQYLPTDQMRAEARRQFQRTFQYRLSQQIETLAQKAAQDYAQNMVRELQQALANGT